ncbi:MULTISPECIES: DUF2147 domain-containing protein [unclassified Acinetobacter]|uniref:DUF2147 domain-containing protein n=1 Tax=unclassified Acinetobacter TaxID=196816 RepID=UPI0025762712|nr:MULTISPECIES: DUF2147 domain-containing protein [unclassified Acinetobacter]MDM1764887.1 DUF2147 domain-containing protein [Acinetobacter sp. 226-1]MDM1768275.1 DUF2147 domain-containing protein [Acinetobacter sp. 226-4]
MLKKSLILSSIFFSTLCFAAPDLTGKWRTVDDKTGYSRADVEISKNNEGVYTGKIIEIRPIPNKPLEENCTHCKGSLKNVPYMNLEILSGFRQSPKDPLLFTQGQVLDPLSGNVYHGKIKLNAKGTRLTMRGYIGVSLLGRSATWIRLTE